MSKRETILEEAIQTVLAMNDVEVERMRGVLSKALELTPEQRRELQIQGDPESLLRVVTDHTGHSFGVETSV